MRDSRISMAARPYFDRSACSASSNLKIFSKPECVKMNFPVRRFVAIQVLLALAPAVFSAPLLHIHARANSDHSVKAHRARALVTHTHLAGCACAGHTEAVVVMANEGGDDAIFLNCFRNNPHPSPSLEFVLVEAPFVPVPEPAAFWTDVSAHRSHDPPLICSLSPRSPPTQRFSSLGA